MDLLQYLGTQAQYVYSLMAMSQGTTMDLIGQKKVTHVQLALEALRNIIRSSPGKSRFMRFILLIVH